MAKKRGQPKEVLKPFKKNDPRINRKGRPPVLPDLKEAIAKLLSQEEGDTNRLEHILNALYKKAIKGDVRAAQELMDRGFGKSQQFVDLTSKGEKFPTIKIGYKPNEED